MHSSLMRPALAAAMLSSTLTPAAMAQDHMSHAMMQDTGAHRMAPMFTREIGAGWRVLGMAQVIPSITTGVGSDARDEVTQTEFYATQPAVMFNVESPGSRVVLRTTLNFEGLTQDNGELTFGGWGEGFIDRRHPHTLLHEAMLSLNVWNAAGGSLSISAGRGFAPYGTDDPMSRPVMKYPTNHHLSQILERYTANAVFTRGGWSVEAGIFDGAEPEGPYDFGNFGGINSWSGRVTRRFGTGPHGSAPWELSASYGSVAEEHDGEERTTTLMNAAVRHEKAYRIGMVYSLVEASRSSLDGDEDGYFAVLGEVKLTRDGHSPYARLEVATRPEYDRNAMSGDGFFRYDHDDHAHAATRWVITSLGYGYEATALPLSARPFVEVQHNNAANERGDVSAVELFGTTSFFSLSAGVRLFLGGEPMRMGTYGVLDAMTAHGRMSGAHTVGDAGMDHTSH